MFDSYQHFLQTPGYNKIIGEDYLIVEFKCPIKEELFTAWSECHSVVYVLSGQKKWITPANDYLVKENQSIFVRKGAFKNQQYFEEGFCVLMFFMKDDFIRRCVKEDISSEIKTLKQISHPNFIYRIHVSESLETLYHSFFSYLKEGKQISQKIIELKFREMLLNICSSQSNSDIKNVFYTIAQNVDGTIERVMEEQFIYNLKVDEFARLCGKSMSSFKREFQKIYNTTPGKWLLAKRLNLASNLMLSTDFTIQQICYDCGFESDSHFIRSFKNEFGVTPKQWKNSKKARLNDAV
ncbi:helix-turn-helix transcriptional regulator [Tamlana fucoidanivorans]|uniref:Helix-turn-helix transcriptional regulator n=1 Tax=Allotamlana fucoidanivorans TaxID=2583814 RepID=A0A5C4SMD3_9FLAO|nr:AraC family transcriptional regulator [Tamlana fucoidanivorans]TNJ45277.1 helix-turn-helix transcriptional regulator [Tamlana fucoidanivorans]